MQTSRSFPIALLLVIAVGTTFAAPRIDSVNRSTHADGQGVDFSPFAEDDQALNNGSSLAGTFSGNTALPIVLNDNTSLYQAVQNSTVNLAGLSFSGTGSIQTSQLTHFDAADQSSGAFLQGAVNSSFTVFFTLTNSGKLSLSAGLGAAHVFSPAAGGSSSCFVQLSKGSTVIWSRYTVSGPVSFNGDIALAAGSYQLTVSAGANVDSGSLAGEFLVTSDASFSISGVITETPGSGGGKKGK